MGGEEISRTVAQYVFYFLALSELKLLSDTMKLECEDETCYDDNLTFEVGELCCARYPGD